MAAKLRGVFHERRIGHSGTLDPMATGVLVLFVGRATRAVEFAESDSKEYLAGLRLGLVTNTQDTSGETLETHPVAVTREAAGRGAGCFPGRHFADPADVFRHQDRRKKLYELARKGQEVERKPRNITIFELAVEDGSGSDWDLRVRCSKGTYVRTLCHDIGQRPWLRGLHVSVFGARGPGASRWNRPSRWNRFWNLRREHDPAELLMPVDALFAQHPALIVTLGQTEKLKHGARHPRLAFCGRNVSRV